jgi:hypothetical protein
MTARELANIPIKLLGLLWIVQGTLAVAGIFMPGLPVNQIAYGLVYNLLFVTVGVVCYLTSEAIAIRLFPEGPQLAIAASVDELLSASFAVIAIYLGAHALIAIAQDAWLILREPATLFGRDTDEVLRNRFVGGFSAGVAQLVIALALFVGRERLVRAWRKLRPMSADVSTDE